MDHQKFVQDLAAKDPKFSIENIEKLEEEKTNQMLLHLESKLSSDEDE